MKDKARLGECCSGEVTSVSRKQTTLYNHPLATLFTFNHVMTEDFCVRSPQYGTVQLQTTDIILR